MIVISTLFLSSLVLATERWNWYDHAFINYSVKQGLPYGSVSAITEDNTGFIWLVTTEGLMRFDGHSFEPVNSKYSQVSDTKVMVRDSIGVLWLGTNKGLISLNPETRDFQSYELLQKQNLSITAIAMDEPKSSPYAWVGTDKGIFKFNTLNFTVERYLQQDVGVDNKTRIFSILIADNGTVWVGTNKGLLYKKVSEQHFSHFTLSDDLPLSMRISDLIQDSLGNIWVGTPRDGVFIIDRSKKITQPEIPNFSQEWIYSITEISPGLVWLGSYGNGIIQMNSQGNSSVRIQHNRLIPSSLANDDIWTIYTSGRGLVWLGTSKGLSLYNSKQTSIKNIFGDSGRKLGISDTNVNSLLEDHQGNIWLGLRENGIDILNPQIGQIEHLAVQSNTPKSALPGGAIETMAMLTSEDIYIGSNWGIYHYLQSSLSRLDLSGRDVNRYTGTIEVIDDVIWAGGTDGLWKLEINPKNKVIADNISNSLAKFTDARITVIKKAPNKNLIIGTWEGLNWIDTDGKLTYQLPVDKPSISPLINSFISSLFYDKRGRLWVATEGDGIFVGNVGNYPDEFTQITKEQGLSSNVIRSMKLDDVGRLWVSGSAGIDVINLNDLSVQSLLPEEGAQLAPYFRQAGLNTSTGEIVFGGSGGITVINPTLWQVNPSYFPLTIVVSRVGNKVDFNPLLGINKDKPIVIKADQNKIAIEFTTLNFIATAAVKYRYRLLGLSESWHNSDSQPRVAAFTTLPPGRYQLEIQNTNRLGQWNPTSHVMYLQVLSYWYQTFYAKILGIISIVFLAFLSVRVRTKNMKKRQVILEEQVEQRTLSLKKATEELDKMSVTDPLTGMNNRRFLERNMPAEALLAVRRYQDADTRYGRVGNADLVFFLIDIDHFKSVNDKYGHKAGDEVLIEVTKRLRKVARESDFLVRWGGEEFLLVVRETSLSLAKELAHRLCNQIKGEPIQVIDGVDILITCSIGFASYPFYCNQPKAISWLECIDIADKALYTAKNSGRDAWVGVKASEQLNTDLSHQHVMDISQGKLHLESNLEQSLIESNWGVL